MKLRLGTISMQLFPMLFAAAIGMVPSTSSSTVATANGNYFVSFTDIELPKDKAGSVLKVGRFYNSRSQFRGMFGYGWGSDFSTYLIPSADGSVVIQESGGGEKTRFGRSDPEELAILISPIVDARVAKVPDGALFDTAAYRQRLMADADFRDEQARDLDKTRDAPVGMVLVSAKRGKQTVQRTATGYVRDAGGGRREFFEQKGFAYDHGVDIPNMRKIQGIYWLTKIEDSSSRKIAIFSYDAAAGNLVKVTNASGSSLEFEYGEAGVVTKVTSSIGEVATYKYCGSVNYDAQQRCQLADLVSHTDSSGDTFRYAYDKQHNLIEVSNPDQTTEKIEYGGDGGVKKVRMSSGATMEYDYWRDQVSPDMHYGTNVLATFPSGRSYNTSYEFWLKRRKDGSTYQYRRVMRSGGDETETIYSECCEQPERIAANGNVTEMAYYPDTNLVRERRTADEISIWEYSQTVPPRITKRVSKQRLSERLLAQYSYRYNDDGLLVGAESLGGQRVAIGYDSEGRISSVEDEKKNILKFEYGPKSKPVRIKLDGVGWINVTYDAKGNIQDIKTEGSSPEGDAVAVKIASMFQALLELVKPAEVVVF